MLPTAARNTIIDSLDRWADHCSEGIWLRDRKGDEFTEWSWRAARTEINAVAAWLESEYDGPGVKCAVLSSNRTHWLLADMAIVAAGNVTVPILTSIPADNAEYIFDFAEVKLLFLGEADNWAGVREVVPATVQIVALPGVDPGQQTLHWYDILESYRGRKPGHSCRPDELISIVFTSGTTGTPRGVVLPLDHIETVAQSLADASVATGNDRALALLPLSTLLENIGSVYVPIFAGAQIIVPDPIETGLLGSSHIDVQAFRVMLNKYCPTTMILPPQLLKLVCGLAAQQQLPDSLRCLAVGGAPVGATLLQQAESLDLPVYQGYGLSEACSVLTVNTPEERRSGSVGKPLSHVNIRIADDGEIYAGGTIFQGYLNTAEHSAEELATGDRGYIDNDGFLFITGRKKNTIITDYGRNMAPEWLESELQAHPDIAQAAVFGNGKPYASAMLVPSIALITRCKNEGCSIIEAINTVLDQVNQHLPDYAQVRKFQLADQPFSTKNDELTGNGRPRRDVIARHYANQISAMYEENHEQVL